MRSDDDGNFQPLNSQEFIIYICIFQCFIIFVKYLIPHVTKRQSTEIKKRENLNPFPSGTSRNRRSCANFLVLVPLAGHVIIPRSHYRSWTCFTSQSAAAVPSLPRSPSCPPAHRPAFHSLACPILPFHFRRLYLFEELYPAYQFESSVENSWAVCFSDVLARL